MIAFLIAGPILGVLARTLRGGPDNPQVALTVPVGVLAFVLLGLLEGGVGRKA